ncbi:MAG: ABC transporter permease [Chloroflexota bacterium]
MLDLARIAGTVVAALIVGFFIVLVVAPKPVEAYRALLTGPVSSTNRFGNWIEDATSLTLLGLAIALVFRARQFSLLAEGQLYLGALSAGIVALFVHLPAVITVPLALLAAAVTGFLFGLIPGYLKASYGASELVSSLMLNVIAQRFYELLLTYWLKPPTAGYTWSDPFPLTGVLPRLVEGTRINLAAILALILTVLTWALVYRTTFGYELRMTGANLDFARYGGVPTRRVIILSMAISGIAAGLAGAHLAMGIHQRLILNISVGLGFEGIVVALLARNNPLAVPLAALLYSYLRIGGDIMERSSAVSSDVVRIVQATIILFLTAEALLAFAQQRWTLRQARQQPSQQEVPRVTP